MSVKVWSSNFNNYLKKIFTELPKILMALQSQIIDEVRLPGFRLLRFVEFDKESDEMAEEERAIALTGSNELDLKMSKKEK